MANKYAEMSVEEILDEFNVKLNSINENQYRLIASIKKLNYISKEDMTFLTNPVLSEKFNYAQLDKIIDSYKWDLSLDKIVFIANPKYTAEQMEELLDGFISNLCVDQVRVYANSELSAQEMKKIKESFKDKDFYFIDIINYIDSDKFTNTQIDFMIKNNKNELTNTLLKIYQNPKLNKIQKQTIVECFKWGGLNDKIDLVKQVKIFARPEFTKEQMDEIIEGFSEDLTLEQVKSYAKPEYNSEKMSSIRADILNNK